MPVTYLISIDEEFPTTPGIYYFRGEMILSNGEREFFEDWLQFTGQSFWMFANEHPLSINELVGDWFRLDINDEFFSPTHFVKSDADYY